MLKPTGLALALALLAAGCKPDVATEIYTSDIHDVWQTGKVVEYKATVSSPVMLTVDDCTAKVEQMIRAIATQEPGVQSRGCAKSGTDTRVSFELPITMRKAGDRSGTSRLVALEISGTDQGAVVQLRSLGNLERLRKEISS